jgi:hypothetical protein
MSDESSIGRTVTEHGSQNEPDASGSRGRCCVARQGRCVAGREIVSPAPDSDVLVWMSLIIMT